MNIFANTINNGFLTRNFNLSRGIRQGCPISALLFILVAKILSIKIRTDENVKDIAIGDVEFKICQLADDRTIFIKNGQSLGHAVVLFQKFQECSGLKLNLEKKSEIIPLRPNRRSLFKLPNSIDK